MKYYITWEYYGEIFEVECESYNQSLQVQQAQMSAHKRDLPVKSARDGIPSSPVTETNPRAIHHLNATDYLTFWTDRGWLQFVG